MKIRTRLTLLYAGAFFLAGAILVALMYAFLRQSLDHQPGSAAVSMVRQFLGERGPRSRPILDELSAALLTQAEQQRLDTLRGMLLWSLISLGLIGVAAGALGWLLAGRVLQPLQTMTSTARRVAERNLHERIALRGPEDEIKVLADTFDAMLERLDRAFDGQHRFVANASHELRTPLAINRTLIEVALDDPAAPAATRNLGRTLLEVNHRHERLIDGLLVLASSEQQLSERAHLDLAVVTQRAVTNTEAASHDSHLGIRLDLRPAFVAGDPVLLERLAQNLIDNAVRYNVEDPRTGWVGVAVNAVTTGESSYARLIVENTGPTVAPAEVDGLFTPFRRLSSNERVPGIAGGAGLGLSIVRAVATAHGGHVRAYARPDGGLLVEVTLPGSQ